MCALETRSVLRTPKGKRICPKFIASLANCNSQKVICARARTNGLLRDIQKGKGSKMGESKRPFYVSHSYRSLIKNHLHIADVPRVFTVRSVNVHANNVTKRTINIRLFITTEACIVRRLSHTWSVNAAYLLLTQLITFIRLY